MVTPGSIEASIRAGIACEYCEVSGDGQHFEAIIVSAQFRGLTRLKQHQLVFAALGDRMRSEIHALSMRTLAPEEWSA
ncbi:MAG: BolA/IbaG family iron-sulfur metabolism protein [Rhodocyclaceae bacterium]|nr:BolA/IbaG family iron-sulfur metabolism protein [Rhodocyclaceae bacterium]MBX3669322.1 BolA/IbaG family iron-sulfur metabolism protein [Rhodocyclaceae bacterium]